MAQKIIRDTSGGKGNEGMFFERSPRLCAAGIPTAQPKYRVADCLRHFSIQDEVDSLLGDAIIPDPKPYTLSLLKHKPVLDHRNAGPFTEGRSLINPPIQTKFQLLVEDLKTTVYHSYWKKGVGIGPDTVPVLPEGYKTHNITFGKKTQDGGQLYDILLPKNPIPDKTQPTKRPGYQTNYNYCMPPFNPDMTFGHRPIVTSGDKWMKCCLTNDKILLGTLNKPINSRQVDFRNAYQPKLGAMVTPNDNISCVPPGYTFGKLKPPDNLPECLTNCEMNPQRELFKKCLAHINTLRKALKKRTDASFFHSLYLKFKYYDKDKTGWLPKNIIYDYCRSQDIRFVVALIEPLLATYSAFNGTEIEYKTFVRVIDHSVPTPVLPKIWVVPDKCLNYRTTYSDMVERNQEPGREMMAGLPAARYFDKDWPVTPAKCCKAVRSCLSEESDVKSCINPNVFTRFGISHRDMYARRSPTVVRKVFESSGEKFTDKKFEIIWNEAKKYHSQEWVCFETFRRALDKFNGNNNLK